LLPTMGLGKGIAGVTPDGVRPREGVMEMRQAAITILLLSVLSLCTTLLPSCDDDGDNGTEAFVLGECRLDDADCRLQ
jgi:hypothetical protein